MPIPPYAALSAATRQQLARLEQWYGTQPHDTAAGIARWLSGDPAQHGDYGPLRREELEHELSAYIASAADDPLMTSRSNGEIAALQACAKQFPAPLSTLNVSELDALLYELRRCAGLSTTWREGGVRTAPDRAGRFVVYPPARAIAARMQQLLQLLHEHAATHRAYAALVFMVAFCNLHPLRDGNGRLSRMLFNAVLNDGCEVRLYLPLHELAALSRGGYLIRLRQAQYHNQWQALSGWLADNAARLSTLAQAGDALSAETAGPSSGTSAGADPACSRSST